MPVTNLHINNINLPEIKNILQTLSRQRKYVWEIREENPDELMIIIHDKKPESSIFIMLMETFASRYFIPLRFRIEIRIGRTKEGCNVNITGDVMMAEMDIIDQNPKPAGMAKLNHAMGEISSTLMHLERSAT